MAGNILQQAYVETFVTDINGVSVNDGSVTDVGTEVDNTATLAMVMDVQLTLSSLTISSTSAYFTVYVVPAVDGTTYPDWTAGTKGNYHDQYAVATIRVKNVSAATVTAYAVAVSIPPAKFKIALGNASGATATATVKHRRYAASYT